VQDEGLTTQQWAVLGALSRPEAAQGMGVGELARYLMVSRQNLSGLITRMERDGHVEIRTDGRDRRSRLVAMSDTGRHVWLDLAQPKIKAYYEQALQDFSMGDMAHTLHYFLKLLDNMEKIMVQVQLTHIEKLLLKKYQKVLQKDILVKLQEMYILKVDLKLLKMQ